MKTVKDHFKPYLTIKGGYKGGRSLPKDGQKSYKLSSNENPIGVAPSVEDAIGASIGELHIYPDTTDIRLRTELVKYYQGALDIDQFICTSSGTEMLEIICRGILKEGDQVIISNPCFVPYRTFSQWSGAEVIDVPLQGDQYQLDITGIVNSITDRTRIIYLTSPNNPTGTYLPEQDIRLLLDQVPSDVVVVYDEVYWHFVEEKDFVFGHQLLTKYPNVISINSFSKAFGLAGLRVGYGYMHAEVASYLRQLVRPFLINTPAMEGAIAALNAPEQVQKTIDVIKAGQVQLASAFTELGLSFTPTVANFFLVDPPIPSEQFVAALFDHRIATRPTDNFGAPGKVRISIGDQEANDALIGALKKILVE